MKSFSLQRAVLGLSIIGLAAFIPAADAGMENKGDKPKSCCASEGSSADESCDFELKDINGKTVTLSQFKGKFVVLEWINHGCPFVVKHYSSGNMQKLQKTYTKKGVVWLSICSSAPGKQGNLSNDEWKAANKDKGSAATTVLLDPDGKVGKMYGASTTPHMFVIDRAGKVIYKGAIDDRPTPKADDVKGAKNYVASALDAALAGKKVAVSSTKPYGCGVKYPN